MCPNLRSYPTFWSYPMLPVLFLVRKTKLSGLCNDFICLWNLFSVWGFFNISCVGNIFLRFEIYHLVIGGEERYLISAVRCVWSYYHVVEIKTRVPKYFMVIIIELHFYVLKMIKWNRFHTMRGSDLCGLWQGFWDFPRIWHGDFYLEST